MSMLKAVIPAILALSMVGCVDLVEKEDLDQLSSQVEKLKAQNAQKNDMQALLYDKLVDRANGMEKKLVEIDILVNTMKAQVARLEDLAKTMQGQIDALGKGTPANPGTPSNPAVDAPKSLKIEDILLEIETVLTQLRGGKIKTDEAITRLKPFAQHAAPRIITELRESVTRFDYARQLEQILGKFPPAELKVPLMDALKRRNSREAAARVVGAAKDKELSKILEEYIGDSDEDFRLNVGEALVGCRNSSGVPLLLGCLKSDQGSTRTLAIAALKKVNRGEDLGYRPQLSPEANAAAIKAWDEWSEKFAKTLFE
jgi:hypothetical protein